MCNISIVVVIFTIFIVSVSSENTAKEKNITLFEYKSHAEIENLIIEILSKSFYETDQKCLAVISDNYYLDVFQKNILLKIGGNISYFMVHVEDHEDLKSPNYQTLKVIRQIKNKGCKTYLVLLANGIQVARFLIFGDRYRVINTRSNFILLHDFRLFHRDLHYLWTRIVNVIFIRRFQNHATQENNNKTMAWYELSTVPFPSPIRGVLVPKRKDIWKSGRFRSNATFFLDNTIDLKGQTLKIPTYPHIPAVLVKRKFNGSNDENATLNEILTFYGLEVEIIRTLAKTMNFNANIYETPNSNQEKWGRKQPNGVFNGLLGEIVEKQSDIALGDFHYTPYHLELMDLTIPYTTECLTFITPESLTDNSWKTLILPFKLDMWIGVIIGLCLGGFIFHFLAKFHHYIEVKEAEIEEINRRWEEAMTVKKSYDILDFYYPEKKVYKPEQIIEGLYLFGNLINSFLYTFGMLLVVSLPKLPTGWSIRMLTGWYWLYCILIVVAYRASMIAILANPPPRVTIDTLQQLADSQIECGGWGDQIKDFFRTSLDPIGQKIGEHFVSVEDPEQAVFRVSSGKFAFYENIYFLKALSIQYQSNSIKYHSNNNDTKSNTTYYTQDKSHNVHIMSECAIQMPISIGLQKNSPLKPKVDEILRRIIEAGLIEKWLGNIMSPILNTEAPKSDTTFKATMNLKKMYGALIVMGIGYVISVCCLIGEILHWKFIVAKRPYFDKYHLKEYYMIRKSEKQLHSKKSALGFIDCW